MTTLISAIKGHQGGFEFYSANIPFKQLAEHFAFDDSSASVTERCQREIHLGRAKKFSTYIKSNPGYITGAVVGTVEDIEFIPIQHEQSDGNVGFIKLPDDYKIVLCDGQHRQKGIAMALEDSPELENHTLPVILYSADTIERKQQIFADINTKSVKPSSSLAIAFNHRSAFLNFVKSLTQSLPYLQDCIEFERSSVSPRSRKLWPLVSFKTFIVNLTGLTEANFDQQLDSEEKSQALRELVVKFIEGLSNIKFWYEAISGMKLEHIRQNTIAAHAVFLEALGIYGNQLIQKFDQQGEINWQEMSHLQNIDVNKTAWIGRCVTQQMTINKNQFGIKSTAALICKLTDTPLSEALQHADDLVSA